MLLSFFRLSLAIRNVWPQHMNFKAFSVLYILLLVAGMPVTLLACIPYGLFRYSGGGMYLWLACLP